MPSFGSPFVLFVLYVKGKGGIRKLQGSFIPLTWILTHIHYLFVVVYRYSYCEISAKGVE